MLPEKIQDIHHAHLLSGDSTIVVPELEKELLEKGFGKESIQYFSFQKIGVDEAKKIQEQARQTHQDKNGIVFFITVASVTHEAQNALLKLFEEPTMGTYFFMIMPSVSTVLPTLLSRVHIIHHARGIQQHKLIVADFLKQDTSERLEMIQKITDIKNKAEEKITLEEAQIFLDELETALYKQEVKDPGIFGEIRDARTYLQNRGASIKMVLEMVALQV
jgi:DNA polymerase III delta prime subunit